MSRRMHQRAQLQSPASASELLLRLRRPQEPEDRLMLAVLLDAVAMLREHATGVSPHGARLVASTVRWFTNSDGGPDGRWPLSFTNVCRTLGLDPGAFRDSLRRELADLGGRELFDPPRTRVIPLRGPESPAALSAPDVRRRFSARPRS